MAKVAVVYHSGSGHTRKMAEAVHAGAAGVAGIEARLLPIEGKDIVEGRWQNDEILAELDRCDAILFGSPTYMGCVSGQMKCFIDATAGRFASRAWKDKLAAGFSVSSGPSGDKLNTLKTLCVFAMQQGMIWVGQDRIPEDEGINRFSFYLGAVGLAGQEPPEEAPGEADTETGRQLGARVAALAARLAGSP